MRKLFLVCMLIPFAGIGQVKNVINFFRVFPKADKGTQFEKALIAHAQKYHTGNWTWRVFEIQTGPDAGGFQVIEGPLSWEEFDGRGDLGTAHTADWNTTVAPMVDHMGTQAYATYLEAFSTVQVNDYADKIIINHVYPKQGMMPTIKDMVTKLKKAWQAGKESVAVYELSYSGDPQLAIVTRLKAGLKELAEGYRPLLSERYNASNGEGSWNEFLKGNNTNVERRWMEMLFYRKDLSSK
jgi:hypothetical protein